MSVNSANFVAFDGKKYSSEDYKIEKSSHWSEDDTTNIYDKETGNILYSQTEGNVSESATTYFYNEDGELTAEQRDWYECGHEFTNDPSQWDNVCGTNQLYRYNTYYNKDGQVAMESYDASGDGILEKYTTYGYNDKGQLETEIEYYQDSHSLQYKQVTTEHTYDENGRLAYTKKESDESITHTKFNENGTSMEYVDKNKDGEIDSHEAEKIIYKNGNDWITKEEYDKANGIDNMVEEPEPEIDNKQESQPAKKETLFEKIANWFKGLFS